MRLQSPSLISITTAEQTILGHSPQCPASRKAAHVAGRDTDLAAPKPTRKRCPGGWGFSHLRTSPTPCHLIREPTSGLEPLSCSLRAIGHALQGVARGGKCRMLTGVSFLWFAVCVAPHCAPGGIRSSGVTRQRESEANIAIAPRKTPLAIFDSEGTARQRGRAWLPMWYGPDIPTSPQPGECYDLVDLGLFEAPRWYPS